MHGQPIVGFTMRKPGAVHHARFLASCLYLMKIFMLADVLPPGVLTPNMRSEVDQIAEYIALFHAPHFLQARMSTAAPRLDLELWTDMCQYEVRTIYVPFHKQKS